MELSVTTEARFLVRGDGSVWIPHSADYAFWTRYLDVFDNVRIIGRATSALEIPNGYLRVDGDGVRLSPIPYYHGPRGYIRRRQQVLRAARDAALQAEAILLRAPGQIASVVARGIDDHLPYGVEVIGDPYDVFAPGALQHPLRPFFRWQMSRNLKSLVKEGSVITYVTERALQDRYPANKGAYQTSFSDVDLSVHALVASPRSYDMPLLSARILLVGTLEQMYKAPDVVIRAVAQLHSREIPVSLQIVGDGKYRSELEKLADDLAVGEYVHFCGQVPSRDAVRSFLDDADLFVLPSRTEGLPRAMIEAMARGLPVLGSNVGGIPELLAPEDIVPAGDVDALTDIIAEVLAHPERMTEMSRRNLARSQDYRKDVLRERRIAFLSELRDRTQEWLTSGQKGKANL